MLARRTRTRRNRPAGRRPVARIHPAVARARRSLGLVRPSSPTPTSIAGIKRQSVVVEVLWHEHELGV